MASTPKNDDDLVAALITWAIKADAKGSRDLAARLVQAAVRINEFELKRPHAAIPLPRRNSEDIHD